jgi:hypothetical protein
VQAKTRKSADKKAVKEEEILLPNAVRARTDIEKAYLFNALPKRERAFEYPLRNSRFTRIKPKFYEICKKIG